MNTATQTKSIAISNMDALPRIESYYGRGNSMNTLKLTMYDSGFQVWYSYKTVVAYQCNWSSTLFVRENIWSNTTGRHLNAIDGGDKLLRLRGSDFEIGLDAALKLNNMKGNDQ